MEYLTAALQFFMLIPAAILCYLPMKNQMAYSLRKTAAWTGSICFLCILLAAGVTLFFGTDRNTVLLPMLILLFFLYRRTLTAPLSKCLAVYLITCALMSFCSIFSYAFDAWLHPYATYTQFSWEAGWFLLGISFVMLALFAVPFYKNFSQIIDRLDIDQIWYITLPVSGIFLLSDIQFIPHSYQTLYVNRVFSIFIFFLIVFFVFLLFLCFLFYQTVALLLDYAKQQENTRFLEIQSEQYAILHNHMEQTRRLRHDFKHSVHALSVMAENGETEELKKHLADYEQELDRNMLRPFCKNVALNALFNHYFATAQTAGIRTDWRISVPEPLTVSELDLLSLLGNILENAIAGCQTVPKPQRYFLLSIETLEQNSLYIVSSNSFDGNLKKKSGVYQTTKKHGHGIGLYSIRTLAEKYHGVAQFSHTDEEFCVDVVLKLQP